MCLEPACRQSGSLATQLVRCENGFLKEGRTDERIFSTSSSSSAAAGSRRPQRRQNHEAMNKDRPPPPRHRPSVLSSATDRHTAGGANTRGKGGHVRTAKRFIDVTLDFGDIRSMKLQRKDDSDLQQTGPDLADPAGKDESRMAAAAAASKSVSAICSSVHRLARGVEGRKEVTKKERGWKR